MWAQVEKGQFADKTVGSVKVHEVFLDVACPSILQNESLLSCNVSQESIRLFFSHLYGQKIFISRYSCSFFYLFLKLLFFPFSFHL